MRVAILGPLEVHTADGCIEIPGRRLRALLVRLALDPGRVVSAERLIDDLWQDEPPAAAHNALQALVSRLRAVLGRTAIESGSGGYRLNVLPESVDVVLFEQRVRAGRAALEVGNAVAAGKQLRAALELWRGDALTDVEGMPFAESEAAGLGEKRVAAIEYLVDAVLAQPTAADAGELLPELEQLRTAFPLREKLHARYMSVLYALGRQAEALAAYGQLRATLSDRLGVDPSPDLAALHLAMLRQAPELPTLIQPASPTPASPLAVVEDPPAVEARPDGPGVSTPRLGNLPAQLTSFIGRESELELVTGLLHNARLVTLTGPGGAGKTRLAQECGARLGALATDGVWFAPLAAVADGADVAQAVLSALGGEITLTLAEIAMDRIEALSPKERLQALLADRQLVLILDNCEHVLDAVAELVDHLLSAAPRVRVLATSREPLALTGETLCPVASLALPPDPAESTQPTAYRPLSAVEQSSASRIAEALEVAEPPLVPSALGAQSPSANGSAAIPSVPSPSSALEYPAVRLLVERALAVRPGFQLTSANVTPVIRICRALDGIPLAIELAAARLRSLTAQQVADRLDDRFRLLSSGSRTALPRHQTLRAIVDWSWELLGPTERTILARLAVFAGGATPDAATEVCSAASADPAAPHTVAPDSASVTSGSASAAAQAQTQAKTSNPASIHARTPSPSAPPTTSTPPIAPDAVIDVIASLVDKSLVVAQEDDAGDVRYRLLETVRAYCVERLEESGDRERIRTAHAAYFVTLAERAEPKLRTAEQIHWITRLTLERENFNAALRHCVTGGDFRTGLRLYQALLWFWMMRNQEREPLQWAEELCELIERTGVEVPAELAEAYLLCSGVRRTMAAVGEYAGDVEAIGNVLLAAVPETAYTARHPLLALIRPVAGVLTRQGADARDARRQLEVLAEHPDPWVRAARYSFTALLELHYANPAVAEELLLTGYAKFRELGERQGLLFTLVLLSEFALAKGQFQIAVSRSQEAYGYATDGLNPESGSILLVKLGQAHACAGEVEHGRRLMEQGARTAEHCGEFADAAMGHAELAVLAFKLDDRAEARRQLAAALNLSEARADRERADVGFAKSTILARCGYLAALDGDFEIARDYYREAVDIVRTGPFLSFMAGLDEVIRGLAALAGLQGDHVRAAELLGSAFTVVGVDNQASYSGPRTREAALAALGEEAFAAAFARGRGTHTSEILALESGEAAGGDR
jgi:predicted ATPase/DNA-binding SARP family transcriptional activator